MAERSPLGSGNPTLAHHQPPPPSTTHTPPPMAAEKKGSSGFLKVIAFFDLLVKLAATGALFGILVLLMQINKNLKNIASGDEALSVRISQQYSSTPIQVAVSQGVSSGPLMVAMTSTSGSSILGSYGNPVHFKQDQ
ncbi:hypothetical protein FZEAL_10686 [Fusarium zealandicum]|uniref:Uncharacterized protein n=1 Tax=Fusarium zealandicum TaxID=1053134 RepID=A0A8H4TY13_9HYPO|nr:hypothetical protein FZEAL_10686 [Fusarium zealandicum]